MNRSKSSRTSRPRTDQREPAEREPRQPPAPGTITAIQGQVRDQDRVSLFIDGSFAIGLARDVAEDAGLSVGLELDAARIAELMDQEGFHRATSMALNFLAYRPRSEGEIRQRLRRHGIEDDVIERVIERLRGWHYVDDADFARRWIENRATHRPRGTRLLAQELRSKGIARDLASEALEEAEVDEVADALTLARQRLRQLSGLEDAVRERRLSGFLGRRGYGFDVIRQVLATIRDEAGNDEELDEPL